MILTLNNFLTVLAEGAASLPEPLPVSPGVLRSVLLGALWLFALAVLIGLPVKYWIGDLWSRKDSQPFVDDFGAHH